MTMTTTSGAPLQARPFSSQPTLIPQLGADGKWNSKIVKIERSAPVMKIALCIGRRGYSGAQNMAVLVDAVADFDRDLTRRAT